MDIEATKTRKNKQNYANQIKGMMTMLRLMMAPRTLCVCMYI